MTCANHNERSTRPNSLLRPRGRSQVSCPHFPETVTADKAKFCVDPRGEEKKQVNKLWFALRGTLTSLRASKPRGLNSGSSSSSQGTPRPLTSSFGPWLVSPPPRTMGPAISVHQGGTGSRLQRAQPLFAAWYGFALNAPTILKSVTILHVTE